MKRRLEPPYPVLSVATLLPRAASSLSTQLSDASPVGRSAQLMRMDRLCGLALCVADRSLLAPRAVGRFEPNSTAVLIGSGYGCHRSDEEFLRGHLDGQPSPRVFAYTLPSSPLGEVSIHHGLLGPGMAIVSGRTAGLEALAEAVALLSAGQARACLVIGCEVAAPAAVERANDAVLCDGATAILLGACADEAPGSDVELGAVVASTTAFVAEAPAEALLSCVAELRQEEPLARAAALLCDPQTHLFAPDALGAVRIVEAPSCGAAAPLAVLAALALSDDTEACVVLSADPSGLGAAVLWRRLRSGTFGR